MMKKYKQPEIVQVESGFDLQLQQKVCDDRASRAIMKINLFANKLNALYGLFQLTDNYKGILL